MSGSSELLRLQLIEAGLPVSELWRRQDAFVQPRLIRIVLLPSSPRQQHLADSNQTLEAESEYRDHALEVWHDKSVQPMTESELRSLEGRDWIAPSLAR